ncbi:MAG: O-antigen ligase family protein [Pseudomonadota bacterium]
MMADSGTQPNRKRWNLTVDWSIKLVAAGMPCMLVLAHFFSGADTVNATALFSLLSFVAFGILILGTGLSSITTGMLALTGIFALWLAFGLFGNWYQARTEVMALAAGLAIWSTGRIVGASSIGLQFAKSALVWTLLFFALVAFVAHLIGQQDASSIIHREFKGRLMAGFGSPNTAATLFVIASLIAVSSIGLILKHREFRTQKRSDQITYLVGKGFSGHALLIISFSCLVLTASRAGNAIGLLVLITLVVFDFRIATRSTKRSKSSLLSRIRSAKAMTLMVLSGGLAFLIWSGGTLASRSANIMNDTGERGELYATYWNIWRDQPWFGHGLGSFNAVNDAAMTMDAAPQMLPVGAAHNVALQWLIQQGLIGTVLMLGIIMALHQPILRALIEPSDRPRNFLRMVIAVSVVLLAHGMVDYALEIPSVMWTWALLLGLGTGFADRNRANKTVDPDYYPSGEAS